MKTGVYNNEGEPLGFEYHAEDPPDPDEWYDAAEDWDDGSCCGPHEWGCCTRCCPTQVKCYGEEDK